MADLVRLSKFLSVMLRHEPAKFGLTLDGEGFTETDAVWMQVTKRYPNHYTYVDLLKVVAGDQDGKKRYEIRGRHIRALFGHSIAQPITYPVAVPPELLYHGTTSQALLSIRETGLNAQNRQYVHLAINTKRAEKVAQRHHGSPVILIVRAFEAHQAGVKFYHPEPEHYLADSVPPVYIDFPKLP
jgi:putative RNA 2'-phosphotransferase